MMKSSNHEEDKGIFGSCVGRLRQTRRSFCTHLVEYSRRVSRRASMRKRLKHPGQHNTVLLASPESVRKRVVLVGGHTWLLNHTRRRQQLQAEVERDQSDRTHSSPNDMFSRLLEPMSDGVVEGLIPARP